MGVHSMSLVVIQILILNSYSNSHSTVLASCLDHYEVGDLCADRMLDPLQLYTYTTEYYARFSSLDRPMQWAMTMRS